MKTFIVILISLLSIQSVNASETEVSKRKRKGDKENVVKSALDTQVSKHIFNPTVKTEPVNGEADVMLRVMPEGNVQVVLIQTKNPVLQKFIERQVGKMKVNKDELVIGEVFKYRFVFKAHQ